MKIRSSRLGVSALATIAVALLATVMIFEGPPSWARHFGLTPSAFAKTMEHPAVPQLGPAERDASAAQIPLSGTFSPVVKQAAPAVVSITTSRMVKTQQQFGLPFFFGPGGPFSQGPDSDQGDQDQGGQGGEQRQYGAGSGVIVSPDGLIVTNYHVVDGASKLEIHLSDRRDFEAKVLGKDAKTDIAVLKIDAKDLPVLHFGNSDGVQVGDLALAIGNPFGIGQTVTMGIVSATGRGNLGIEDYEDFIQTDAAINPGNSGGALINTRGELIGINTAILSRGGGGNQGVGFAIPVNLAHHVMTQLVENGHVVRGYLGVGIQDLTPDMAKVFKASDSNGALVREVEPNGPGAKAGLQRGDVIREVNGNAIDDSRELKLKISGTAPGETVQLAVVREGSEKTLTAKLGELPGDQEPVAAAAGETSALEGLQVDELTPAIARQLKVDPDTKGVVVTNVDPSSAASEAGLRRGDVVMEVNRKPVTNVSEFRAQVQAAGDNSILLLVNHNGNVVFLVVESR
jgi:serine protease Do